MKQISLSLFNKLENKKKKKKLHETFKITTTQNAKMEDTTNEEMKYLGKYGIVAATAKEDICLRFVSF